MNINEIYGYQRPLIETGFADFYDKFARDMDKDSNFSLLPCETAHLFNEVLLMYLHDNMTPNEWDRIISNLN